MTPHKKESPDLCAGPANLGGGKIRLVDGATLFLSEDADSRELKLEKQGRKHIIPQLPSHEQYRSYTLGYRTRIRYSMGALYPVLQ